MIDYSKIFENLLKAETEEEVNNVIKNEEILQSNENWRVYGDLENNWGSVGNQQDEASAALVEKLTNAIDALLLYKCQLEDINPRLDNVPDDIFEAAEKFFGVRKNKLHELPKDKLSNLARNIQLIATGQKGEEGNPSLAIVDFGEGQNPESFPDTFLSLHKSNKSNIPFVTGKFNMGGTGVVRYCGEKHGYQLIVSKRAPQLKDAKQLWGFTLIRRLRPTGKMKNSVIQYFAPRGNIPTIKNRYLNLLPTYDGKKVELYKSSMEWGTYVKLYEYQISERTNIVFDLFRTLNRLLYCVPLPVRLVECREYGGHTPESNLIGMDQRLQVDRSELLDDAFPASSFNKLGPLGKVEIKYYLFKYGTDKKKLRRWIGREPIYFTINGQTHAKLSSSFLKRKNVNLDYLEDYLLVNIDCTEIPNDIGEDLFMPSRDRMAKGEIRYQIEKELESILKSHDGLRQKCEYYRQQKVKDKIADENIKLDVLNKVIGENPLLAKLFGKGTKLSDPFKRGLKKGEFEGKRFPTYFKIAKKHKDILIKECPKNGHCVVLFLTDAVNDYLTRINEPGELIYTNGEYVKNIFLFDGILHFEVHPNNGIKVGDELEFQVKLTSPEPINGYFEERFRVAIIDSKKKRKKKKKKRKSKTEGLAIPKIYKVNRNEWEEYEWDENDTVQINQTETNTDAYVNIDNVNLRREINRDSKSSDIIEEQFIWGMVVVGLVVKEKVESLGFEEESKEIIRETVNSVGKIILPVIRGLGNIENL